MDYIYRKKKIKNHIYVWLCRKGVFLLKIYYKFNNKLYTDLRSLKLDSFSKINKDFFNNLSALNGQALHAETLEFIHPIKKKLMSFKSKLPIDFKKTLDLLNNLSG